MKKIKLSHDELSKIAFLTTANMSTSVRSKVYKAFYFFDTNSRFIQERYIRNFILCNQ